MPNVLLRYLTKAIPTLVLFISTTTLCAQPVIEFQPVITSGLNQPIEVVTAPGDASGRLFIVEKPGVIRIWNGSSLLATPFLDISGDVIDDDEGEQGLLSMAFHPNYASNGYFFVYYNDNSGNVTLERYQVSGNPNVANPAPNPASPIISISKPFANHNGGHIQFKVEGGINWLYMATGDGGGAHNPGNEAQNPSSLLGKLIRINANNLGAAPQIWAWGLRNPFKWSFDRLNGDIFLGDVGQGLKEEVSYRAGNTFGANYGWVCFEGLLNNSANAPAGSQCDTVGSAHVPPIFTYNNPSPGAASIVGGYVYRGTEFPSLYGYYITLDFYSGQLWLLKKNGASWDISPPQTGLPNMISSISETSDGSTLYTTCLTTGFVYKVGVPGGGGGGGDNTPYLGTPHPIPGTIQAEDFDLGGQNIARFDNTSANDGGVYRQDGVDIENSTEGSPNIAYTEAGEWAEYSVNVTSAGTYSLQVRVSSPSSGKSLRVEMDGTTIATISVPNTGGWQNWQTVTVANISLTAGNKVMRIFNVTDGFNINYVTFVATGGGGGGGGGGSPYGGTPRPIPGTIQAEDFDNGGQNVGRFDNTAANDGGVYRQDGVDIETSTEGTPNVAYIEAGEWTNYTVNVTSAGTYTLQVRVSSPSSGKSLRVEMDGTTIATIAIPDTDGWQNWTTVSVTNISLSAGIKVMRIFNVTDGFNINYVTFVATGGGGGGGGGSPYGGTPRPIPGTIQAEDFDNGGQNVGRFDNTAANDGGVYRQDGVDIENSTEGTPNVAYIEAGEWTNYTVNVTSAGTYSLQVRVSSPFAGKSLRVEMDGTTIATINVPDTDGWQNWTTVTVTNISLTAGIKVMRIFNVTDGFNINYVTFVSTAPPGGGGGGGLPYGGTPYPIPGTIQAEDFDNGGQNVGRFDNTSANDGGVYRYDGVDIEMSNEGSPNIAYIEAGEWTNYTVNVTSAGTYTLQVRLATPLAGKSLRVEMDGTTIATINVPDTDGWQNWTTVSVPNINLTAGIKVMRIFSITNGFNINYVTFSQTGGFTARPGDVEVVEQSGSVMEVYPNPAETSIQIKVVPPAGASSDKISLKIYDAAGIIVHQDQFQTRQMMTRQIDISRFKNGAYIVEIIFGGKIRRTMRFIKT